MGEALYGLAIGSGQYYLRSNEGEGATVDSEGGQIVLYAGYCEGWEGIGEVGSF